MSRPNGLPTSHLPVFPILAPSEISPSAGPDLSTSLTPCCRIGVVALGYQPKVLPTYSGAVPDVECPFGVSPAQSFCYATAPPRSTQASKAPDTDVPPASTQASTAP